MTYKKASPRNAPPRRKDEIVREIGDMAELILDGEESLLEEYNTLVDKFADVTRGQAPAFESDPVMYKELCDKWGREPTKTVGTGGKMRYLNYTEMTRFMRGYWR